MHKISLQTTRNLLEIHIQGFWNVDMFYAFQRDVFDAVPKLTAGGRRHVVMVNVSETAIQTQEVVALLQTLIATEDPQPARLAFVATTALSRMQARRLVIRDNIRMFDNQPDAERWLDAWSETTPYSASSDPS